MNFEKAPEPKIPKTYEALVQEQLDNGAATTPEEAANKVELAIFNERIGKFTESDLVQDPDGSWKTFEDKVRKVFPEIPEDRFRGMKAGVTMHLCGL